MRHLRLLSFALSAASFQGQDWVPKDPGEPGALQIHLRGSSLFLRIVGLKPQADIDDEDGEEAYAPTFNVQEELVQFHHSPNDHAHWCAIFTIMTTRDSPDIKRFRTGPGADLLHCLVSSQTITPAQNQKLLVSIETCVPRGYIHRISAKIASQVYQDLMRERSQDPPTIDFSFHDSDGSVIQHALGCDELRLGDGTPIGTPLMDLLFKVNCSHGPGRIISGPSLTQDVEMACQWMCANPPPTVWRGLRLNPLHALGRWSLLVAEYRGPGIDVDVIIIDPLRTPVDAGPSEIFSQIVGTQRMKIHPILFEGRGDVVAQPWKSGYFVLDYLAGILKRARADDWQIPEVGAWRSELNGWQSRMGIQLVRTHIAKTLMNVQTH